jgi:hypothetical protein
MPNARELVERVILGDRKAGSLQRLLQPLVQPARGPEKSKYPPLFLPADIHMQDAGNGLGFHCRIVHR